MATTLLEQTRAFHEDIERLERVVVLDLQQSNLGHAQRLQQSHRVKGFVESIVESSQRLAEIYEDSDGSRKDEIAAIGGQTEHGTNVFGTFYDRMKEIREYHRKHPEARVVETVEDPEELIKQEPWVEFSGEEAYGRYLDLHELFNVFVNSKFGKSVEYAEFVGSGGFLDFSSVPTNQKLTKAYRDYLDALLSYLVSFFERTQPLQPLDPILEKVSSSFAPLWDAGSLPGWQGFSASSLTAKLDSDGVQGQTAVDLTEFDTVEELLDPDLVAPHQIKEALATLGLKTGGTPQQRAERLLLTKNTPLKNIDPIHFAPGGALATNLKKKKGKKTNKEDGGEHARQLARQVALQEAKIAKLADLLKEVIAETKAHLEKKQALTFEEMEAERDEAAIGGADGAGEDSGDEEEEIYNPLKLPMGWDGKPIPYWLYKLHGLGQEFKCEICGNQSYWGRRAFERHFKEWRHQHGMRCLGIPNTKNFNEITIIKDAEALWEKIKEKQGINKWRPDVEEEYEDSEGNVYNKKTFTDLKKQGLL